MNLWLALSLQEHITDSLNKNKLVRSKPYFGRVDYLDKEENKSYSLYIGKHGINKDKTTILTVDWRAAAAGIYYECAMGEGKYHVEDGSSIPIRLDLKRTYDIENGKLKGFFDSDTVANDELLVKYLSQNKDVVLGEIIATIQKEQILLFEKNLEEILFTRSGRKWKNHRCHSPHIIFAIQFFRSLCTEEFCIIGSNKILLNYITSGLPDLDVHNTKQFRMDEFFLHLLEEKMPLKKYKQVSGLDAWKSFSPPWILSINWKTICKRKVEELIPRKEIREGNVIIFGESNIEQCLTLYREQSAYQKITALSERLIARIKLVTDGDEPEYKKMIMKKYRSYFKISIKSSH